MSNSTKLLWLLRIYGPCSVAVLMRTSRWGRDKVTSALRHLRDRDLAERREWATYRLTERGARRLEGENLFAESP